MSDVEQYAKYMQFIDYCRFSTTAARQFRDLICGKPELEKHIRNFSYQQAFIIDRGFVKNTCTYAGCYKLTGSFCNNNEIKLELMIYEGDLIYGEPTDARIRYEFEFPISECPETLLKEIRALALKKAAMILEDKERAARELLIEQELVLAIANLDKENENVANT